MVSALFVQFGWCDHLGTVYGGGSYYLGSHVKLILGPTTIAGVFITLAMIAAILLALCRRGSSNMDPLLLTCSSVVAGSNLRSELGGTMGLSEIFIRRPIGTILLAIGIALVGLVAYVSLPVAPLPQVEFPTIQVKAQLPGASAETMASSVATP